MPSFLGRLLGLSFRTELLIMNLVGLVNSTLDWSPLKWTNKLERIWNLSLSQRTLILDTIGEDTIKTVLSWVVITRIVIAHVYTFTYITNIYPIITWSRPNLLLPWLILSFFKNVVLEVIVIVIGLLIWYETQFSVIVFLEFILVKLVPLILACYNWYSNSCLFMQLRYIEKMQSLRRTMRSDSNLLANRLCEKIEDSKYRTRSLTTLLSCESYDTYDSRDTISRILDDPTLSLAQKTLRILGLTEKDVEAARSRIRERDENNRLTAKSSMFFRGNNMRDKYLLLETEYEMFSIVKINDNGVEYKNVEKDSSSAKTVSSPKIDPEVKEPETEEKHSEEAKNATVERRLSGKKRERTEQLDMENPKQMKLCSSCFEKNSKCRDSSEKEGTVKDCCSQQDKKTVEKSCDPVKLQELFHCNCMSADYPFEGNAENCCTVKNATLNTSTPIKSFNDKAIAIPIEQKSVADSQASKPKEDALNLSSDMFSSYRNTFDDWRGFSSDTEDAQQIHISTEIEPENNLVDKAENELSSTLASSNSSSDGASSIQDGKSIQVYSTSDEEKKEDKALKLRLPDSSLDNKKVSRIYRDFMKIFDGCYEKDFDNNPELQCVLQQLTKKGWNSFPSQGGLEMLLTTAFSEEVDDIVKGIQNLRIEDSVKMDRYEDPSSGSLKCTPRPESSHEAQPDGQGSVLQETKNLRIGSSPPIKNVSVQTFKDFQPKNSFRSLSEAKKRKNRRRLKNQNESTMSIVSKYSVQSIKAESFSTARKTCSKSQVSNEEPRKPPGLLKSQSDKSVCECKMQNLEVKHCASSESRLDRKDGNRKAPGRQKVENFGTIPLPQVSRANEDQREAMFRKKPPVCPKKNKKEVPGPTVKKFNKKPAAEVVDSKQLVNKLFSSRMKAKSRVKDMGEQEAFNMRALKAYNEVTLVRHKRHLEDKGRSAGNPVDVAENSKNRSQARKPVPPRAKKEVPKSKDHLNKENLLVDATTETDPSAVSSSKDVKMPPNLPGAKSFNVPNDKYSGTKLLSVNKVTERLLDNLDRLHGSQTKQDTKKTKHVVEVDSRKQYTKYSKPKKLSHEENLSVTSSKKLEGIQKGRELDRTPAKEDVRDSSAASGGPAADRPLRVSTAKTDVDSESPEAGIKDLLTTIKSRINQDVISSWSSSTLSQTDEVPITVDQNMAQQDLLTSLEIKKHDEDQKIEKPEDQKIEDQKIEDQKIEDQKPEDQKIEDQKIEDQKIEDQKIEDQKIEDQKIEDQKIEDQKIEDQKIEDQKIEELEELEEPEDQKMEEPEDRKMEEPKTVTPSISATSNLVVIEERPEVPLTSEEDSTQRIESSQSDPLADRRRLDFTNFARNIDVSFHSRGVVLANTNAQGKSNRRDIVNDNTARLVHEAFSYISMELLLDPPEPLTMEDVLNGNQLVSCTDEFVCQTTNNDAIDALAEELPLISCQGNTIDQSILSSFRDSSQSESGCDLCIIAIQQEDSATGFEAEDAEDFGGLQQSRMSGVPLGDFLMSFLEVLRSLNICDIDLRVEDIRRIHPEIEDVAELGEEEEEEEGSSEEEDDTLRFIKEDVFTDIKFPIVIDRSSLAPEVLTVWSNFLQPLSARTEFPSFMTMNFLPSIEGRKEEPEEIKNLEDTEEEVEPLKDNLLDSASESDSSSTNESLRLYLDASDSNEDNTDNRKAALNETFDVVEPKALFSEKMFETGESIASGEANDVEIGGVKAGETLESVKADIDTQDEELSEEEVEKYAIEETREVNEKQEPVDAELTEIVNFESKVSMKDVFVFWFIVFFFYIRFFWQKVRAFAQTSRTTSTLKPFEVHAVSTSTSALLESTELFNKIREQYQIDDESTEEFNIDLEETEESYSYENLRRTLSSGNINAFDNASAFPNVAEDASEDDLEDLVTGMEELTLNFNKQELSEASLLPSFDEESVTGRYNYILSTSKLRDDEPHCSFSIVACADDNRSSWSDKLEGVVESKEVEIEANNANISTFESELEKLSALLRSEEEIETFRFKEVNDSNSSKSLLADDHRRSCEDQLNVAVKAVIEEEISKPEDIRISYAKGESNLVTLQSNKESSQIESDAKNAIETYEKISASEASKSTDQNVRGAERSTERTEIVSSAPFETNLEEIDSFNSAYTRPSEMSENVSSVDLNGSSMEEFLIASNVNDA